VTELGSPTLSAKILVCFCEIFIWCFGNKSSSSFWRALGRTQPYSAAQGCPAGHQKPLPVQFQVRLMFMRIIHVSLGFTGPNATIPTYSDR
jgi:hypothetical protein